MVGNRSDIGRSLRSRGERHDGPHGFWYRGKGINRPLRTRSILDISYAEALGRHDAESRRESLYYGSSDSPSKQNACTRYPHRTGERESRKDRDQGRQGKREGNRKQRVQLET